MIKIVDDIDNIKDIKFSCKGCGDTLRFLNYKTDPQEFIRCSKCNKSHLVELSREYITGSHFIIIIPCKL